MCAPRLARVAAAADFLADPPLHQVARGTPLGATRPSTTAPSRPWALAMPQPLPPLLALIRGVRIFRGGDASLRAGHVRAMPRGCALDEHQHCTRPRGRVSELL